MRFYLKCFALIVTFTYAARFPCPGALGDLALDARVAYVNVFGTATDYQRLIEDIRQTIACEQGNLDDKRAPEAYGSLLRTL